MLRTDPRERPRLVEIKDNLLDRVAEAEREGWLGDVEDLHVALTAAKDKLVQLDARIARRAAVVDLGTPAFPEIASRSLTLPKKVAAHKHELP